MASLHFDAGRLAERKAVLAFIRARTASTEILAQRGRITAADQAQLVRWLNALADDIGAGLHEEGAKTP